MEPDERALLDEVRVLVERLDKLDEVRGDTLRKSEDLPMRLSKMVELLAGSMPTMASDAMMLRLRRLLLEASPQELLILLDLPTLAWQAASRHGGEQLQELRRLRAMLLALARDSVENEVEEAEPGVE